MNNQNKTHEQLLAELVAANKELILKNKEKEKQARELSASEIRYRRLFESAKDGILILDAETGKITDVNPFLIDLLDYSKDQFLDKTIWEIGFFRDIISNKEKFLELQQNKYVRYEDLPLETASGRQINVEFVSNVYMADNHKVIQCNIRDITERKQSESKLLKAHEQLKQLLRHEDEIRENERKTISREIHDELGQSLSALKVDLGWTKDNVSGSPAVSDKIDGMIDIVSDTIKNVQRISADLRLGLLDDLGLIPAMEWYCQEFEKRTKIKCIFKPGDILIKNNRKKLTLYRVLQEALTNVLRHAGANEVNVNYYNEKESVILKIKDNGTGIDTEKISSGLSLGIVGLRERANQFNGRLRIKSTPGKGTELIFEIPVDKNEIA
jgi:PAS domain S-box-containing protein